MADTTSLSEIFSAPAGFKIREVDGKLEAALAGLAEAAAPPPPNLGPLVAFVGTWTGQGFNTIFRPNNTKTPTVFVPPITSDNVLELNLTRETLSFSNSLGSIPNRGTDPQGISFSMRSRICKQSTTLRYRRSMAFILSLECG